MLGIDEPGGGRAAADTTLLTDDLSVRPVFLRRYAHYVGKNLDKITLRTERKRVCYLYTGHFRSSQQNARFADPFLLYEFRKFHARFLEKTSRKIFRIDLYVFAHFLERDRIMQMRADIFDGSTDARRTLPRRPDLAICDLFAERSDGVPGNFFEFPRRFVIVNPLQIQIAQRKRRVYIQPAVYSRAGGDRYERHDFVFELMFRLRGERRAHAVIVIPHHAPFVDYLRKIAVLDRGDQKLFAFQRIEGNELVLPYIEYRLAESGIHHVFPARADDILFQRLGIGNPPEQQRRGSLREPAERVTPAGVPTRENLTSWDAFSGVISAASLCVPGSSDAFAGAVMVTETGTSSSCPPPEGFWVQPVNAAASKIAETTAAVSFLQLETFTF